MDLPEDWQPDSFEHIDDPAGDIDPRLLDNLGGCWPSSEGSHDDIGTTEQLEYDVDNSLEQDLDMVDSPSTALPGTETYILHVPQSDEQDAWQQPRTPQHRYATRRMHTNLYTPNTSLHSYLPEQDADYDEGSESPDIWECGSPFAPSRPDTTPDVGEYVTQGRADFERYPTPSSNQQQGHNFNASDASPSFRRHSPKPTNDHSEQSMFSLGTNVASGFGPQIPPSHDIPSWTQGPYTLTSPPDTAVALNPTRSQGTLRASTARNRRTSSNASGPFFCDRPDCESHFPTKSKLDHHRRYHDQTKKKEECEICQKTFLFKKDLERHIPVHTGERPWSCTYTDCLYHVKGFKRKDHLKRHLQKRHKEEDS